jgi:hypothetical protein
MKFSYEAVYDGWVRRVFVCRWFERIQHSKWILINFRFPKGNQKGVRRYAPLRRIDDFTLEIGIEQCVGLLFY